MLSKRSVLWLLPFALNLVKETEANTPLVPFAYDPLPLGSITPNGWLKTELETSAAGLGGHLYDFYRFVKHSSWIGGDQEYSDLNEALPYWVNALVPLAYTAQDDRLKAQVHDIVDNVISRIQPDGWIGPETLDGNERMIWARTLLFLGWMNLADANSTYETPIVDAMLRFNGLMNTMLKDNGTGMIWHEGDIPSADDFLWFRARAEDMMVSVQWLIDNHPRNQTQILMENLDMMHQYAYKWEGWYTEQTYIKEDFYDLPQSVTDDNWQFLHGVTIAEGLKYAAVLRRSTFNDSLLTTAMNGVNWTFEYHGSPSGTILADERIDGLNPYYGSELCTDVETMYSLAYNYFAIGDPYYADRAELAAYNALPAALMGDWWSHQYMTEPNQPYSKDLSATPFYDDNSLANTFALEPNYPCCTVNHPQGYPKFVLYSYVKKGDTGLVHALLSPGRVQTEISGKTVSVNCDTDYPFDNTLSYTVDSDTELQLYLRVPNWSTGVTIEGLDTPATDSSTGLMQFDIPSGITKFNYTIGTELVVTPRANDTVSVYRGALLYALYIKPDISPGPPKFYNNQSEYPAGTYPPQAQDYVLLNTTEWNVAIDPTTLAYNPGSGPLPEPTFQDGALPMSMTATGCLIDWPMFLGAVPGSPIPKKDRTCLGDAFNVTLRPYGSAKLHMSEIPTIDLSGN
ncbi:uncharacterized protein N7483_004221 [Penicillium malachiteum]|uniref:uncharacterized protein n=1 Tax=Penicillium malachiteum TaxID=1324776 RepID=UPI002548181A|nr:uncharacterized protein N7483_004221 [Penicillium malachiteum]KAJ5729713.1 hypothetical protein N7483_004221 [Penicillium malachiteum]